MQLTKFYFFLLIWIVACPAIANEPFTSDATTPPVFSKAGNLYYTPTAGKTIQITHSGKDSSPVLSSNRKWVAFTRVGNQLVPESCGGNTGTNYGSQIWIYDLAVGKERLLVAGNFQCNEPKKQIIDPRRLTFSPDDKTLYFTTSAWTTSGALHGINVDGTHQRYIVPANSLTVITKGKYKGYFIVNQHRYFAFSGGSYDWYWLVSPDGKDEKPLGEEITKEQEKSLLES